MSPIYIFLFIELFFSWCICNKWKVIQVNGITPPGESLPRRLHPSDTLATLSQYSSNILSRNTFPILKFRLPTILQYSSNHLSDTLQYSSNILDNPCEIFQQKAMYFGHIKVTFLTLRHDIAVF